MNADFAFQKRLFDIGFAVAALLMLAPLLALIALAVALDSRGSVLYVHERIGQFGRPFPFLKFRTMVSGAHHMGRGWEVDANDSRITRVGAFLRRWHLDELPQLVNVLRGDMSLIGPRPTLAYQVAEYTPEQRRRLLVLPGLTGRAQVEGLNALTWPERIRWDCWYVEHACWREDLTIMARTFSVLAQGEHTYGHGWESSAAAADEKGSPDAS